MVTGVLDWSVGTVHRRPAWLHLGRGDPTSGHSGDSDYHN